ncbi:MAG TPA: tetraacyldisaccharide 4'-kinase, partial [Flavobacterium sp.]|nr:tetraacyldisaccharide 4'-kinase [Flavobacterium sp.]
MGFLRKLLFPLAILYGFVTALRNMLYDRGWLQSVSFDVPVIAVGNLSVGGTGKSPMVEYLIRLLQPDYRIAVLSRGYKRQTHGFRLASKNDSAETLGDEPFQFYKKFPAIRVAVDADRVRGIKSLLNLPDAPQVILLDDAFQHRRVKAGYYIVLTAYGDLYADDFMLPTGNLREGWRGAKRANCIVVTKCPSNLSDAEQDLIRKKLQI